jgi:hypothetical protein
MTATDNRRSQRDMSRRILARFGEVVRFRIELACTIKSTNKASLTFCIAHFNSPEFLDATLHADRLNLRWVMYSAFKEGQSVAIQRLNEKKDRAHRTLFHFGRLTAAPFHFVINLLAALFLWPFNCVKAVDLLKRSVMILGLACQLTKEIPRTIIPSK